MTVDDLAIRLRATWYRNGMHDILRTSSVNDVAPLTATEIRDCVAGFQAVFIRLIDDIQAFIPTMDEGQAS